MTLEFELSGYPMANQRVNRDIPNLFNWMVTPQKQENIEQYSYLYSYVLYLWARCPYIYLCLYLYGSTAPGLSAGAAETMNVSHVRVNVGRGGLKRFIPNGSLQIVELFLQI